MSSFTSSHFQIKIARQNCWTHLCTLTATCTLVPVNKRRFSLYLYLEIAQIALYLFNLTIGVKLDIGMSSHIIHLRRENTLGTIQGRESFTQSYHISTERWLSLNYNSFNSCIRQIKGCLHSSNSSTDDQGPLLNRNLKGMQRCVGFQFLYSCINDSYRLASSGFRIILMRPSSPFSNICNLHTIGI